jgi:anti-sigma factor ChrR (cupin superfamily)
MPEKKVSLSPNGSGATLTTEILYADLDSGYILQRQISTPGFQSEKHDHTAREVVYVEKGLLIDHTGEYPAGSVKINEKGFIHQSHNGPEGCTLLIWSKGGHASVEK